MPADLEVVPEAMPCYSSKHIDVFSPAMDAVTANLLAKDAPIIPPPITKCLYIISMSKIY